MGLLPSNSRLGALRDKLLTKIFYRVINQYLPALNTVREAFSLPLYSSLPDIYHQADLRLIQTSKVFDAPITPAPTNVRYVGPVLDDPAWSNSEYELWPKDDMRPLVVVSLSTTFQNQLAVLKKIISAVAGMPVRCLVTLGPAMSKESFEAPENVILLSAIPHNYIFPEADAVVTHAGHGTVMRALAHGLPLVCMPMGRDQIDNAALVAHHGAGLKLRSSASANQIQKAIKRALDEPSFTKGAQTLQKHIRSDAKADLGVNQLESLAVT
jgi:MGT family glycosyltransferase